MSFRSAWQRLFGLANRQLADMHLQFQIGELVGKLLAVELDERFARVNFAAMLDDFLDLELRPLIGPQGDRRHLLGGEHAVEHGS